MATTQISTFYVGGLFLGIDVTRVQEVFRFQEMTRVPLAPKVIRGLINLRGQIVTALEMRERLGMPERIAEELPMNIVVRADEGVMSLLVDEIGDVIELAENQMERPPDTLRGASREFVKCVYKLPNKLLLVLDTERLTQLRSVAPKSTDN